ncbi:MAG: helix-turn-helix transcriptional regulator [Agriterribacter sp.]
MNDREYLKSVGCKIRLARNNKGLTLKQLEKMTGIHYSSLPEIENGKRNFNILTVKKIADSLGTNIKEFL